MVIFIVGFVDTAKLLLDSGYNTATIVINALYPQMQRAYNNVMKQFNDIHTIENSLKGIRASHYVVSRSAHTGPIFGRVFDARAKFSKKDKMPALSPTNIVPDDLVLLECHLIRFQAREDNVTPSGRVVSAGQWIAKLDLESISLLGKGQGVYVSQELDEAI